MANPIVVDLSHWNPTPNWDQLKAGGTVGVIHKATQSTNYVDDQLFSRAKNAMAAGLSWSTYHFLVKGNPENQMAFYLKTINPRQGERVCIDHEKNESTGTAPTLAELEQAVSYLLRERPDLQITIYSGNLIKEQLGSKRSALLAGNTSLWVAHYTSNASPTWPTATWPAWSLWQYTDKAQVSGISAGVDGNRWNGDPANLPKWFGPAEAPAPSPEPEPAAKQVLVAITAPEGVEVIVTVNGREPIPAT